jgi:hypothetical protein
MRGLLAGQGGLQKGTAAAGRDLHGKLAALGADLRGAPRAPHRRCAGDGGSDAGQASAAELAGIHRPGLWQEQSVWCFSSLGCSSLKLAVYKCAGGKAVYSDAHAAGCVSATPTTNSTWIDMDVYKPFELHWKMVCLQTVSLWRRCSAATPAPRGGLPPVPPLHPLPT